MRILISGASIAGPSLSYWLCRQGFDVTLVERAPALRMGGYAVDIRGPALDVIERMGLRDALRPLETDTQTNAVVDVRGRRFGRMARGFGVIDPGDIEVLRGDLSHVFYEATRERVHYRFGDSIASLRQSEHHVSVEFQGGTRETYDLVIGADGVHSRTRELAFGTEPGFTRELGSCMAIFSAPNHLGLEREQLLFNDRGRIASIKSCNQDRELKICVFFTSAPGAFPPRDVQAQRRLVAEAFAGAGWEFPRFLEAMWSAEDFYCDVTCQIRLPSFHSGRVALVGDAAYCPSPLSGQGTSLALVGGYVLAAALAEARGDHLQAFARYDELMRPFVLRNQDIALKLAEGFAPQSTFQVWARNLVMRMLPYMPWSHLVMKLAMRDVRAAAHALTLPEQPPPSEQSVDSGWRLAHA